MRRFLLILILFLFATLFTQAEVKAAPRADLQRTPAEIISLINEYRAENGLPAYVQNSILMGTAQDASDYQAAIESVTHEGPGGSRPRDRAYAAGYGDGKIIWISEIIYGYTFGTPQDAVNWWKTSEIHNYTMLAPQYKDIGAGVAVANNRYYFTAVVGWISIYDNPDATPTSGPSRTPSNTPQASATTAASTATKTPTKTASNTPSATFTPGPSLTPTPLPEGALIHVVQSGETLTIIAALYDVDLEEILALNNLTPTSLIFPGDKILIQLAPTPTPTQTPTASSTETGTASPSPSTTPSPSPTSTLTATPSPASTTTEVLAPPLADNAPPLDPLNSLFANLEFTEVRALAAIALFGVALVPLGILTYLLETRRG